MAVAQLWY